MSNLKTTTAEDPSSDGSMVTQTMLQELNMDDETEFLRVLAYDVVQHSKPIFKYIKTT